MNHLQALKKVAVTTQMIFLLQMREFESAQLEMVMDVSMNQFLTISIQNFELVIRNFYF